MKVSMEMKRLILGRCANLVKKENAKRLVKLRKEHREEVEEYETFKRQEKAAEEAAEIAGKKLGKLGFYVDSYDGAVKLLDEKEFPASAMTVSDTVIADLQGRGDDTTANALQIADAIEQAFSRAEVA